MKVLIYGDSQSGYTGKKLADLLQAQGATVTRITRSGKSTQWLSENAAKSIDPNWDAVIIFSGGNDGNVQSKALASLLTHFKAQSRVYVPLPPATIITDLPLGKKVWGSATPEKFFPKTAAFREVKKNAYVEVAEELGYVVKDPRKAKLTGAVEQPSGVVYPSQPDGIHTAGQSAQQLAEWVATPPSPARGMTPTVAFGLGMLAFLLLRR